MNDNCIKKLRVGDRVLVKLLDTYNNHTDPAWFEIISIIDYSGEPLIGSNTSKLHNHLHFVNSYIYGKCSPSLKYKYALCVRNDRYTVVEKIIKQPK